MVGYTTYPGRLEVNGNNDQANGRRTNGFFSWTSLILGLAGVVLPLVTSYITAQLTLQQQMWSMNARVSQLERLREEDVASNNKKADALLTEIRANRRATLNVSRNVDRLLIKAGLPLSPPDE